MILMDLCNFHVFQTFISTTLFCVLKANDVGEVYVQLTRLYQNGVGRCVLFKEDISSLLYMWNQIQGDLNNGLSLEMRTITKIIKGCVRSNIKCLEICEVIRTSGIVSNTFTIFGKEVDDMINHNGAMNCAVSGGYVPTAIHSPPEPEIITVQSSPSDAEYETPTGVKKSKDSLKKTLSFTDI